MSLSRRRLLALMGGSVLASCSSDSMTDPPNPGDIDAATLPFASLRDVARLIEAKHISPVELTQMILDRISIVDPRLKSYATVMADHALAAARIAEQEIHAGNYRGPLHGVPIAVKDLCYTKGIRTMGGLGVLADFVPNYDATVVSKLEQSGAILLGKLNMTEGAMAGYHPDFDIPVNPWRDDLWAGASSSGSGVATAAGLCFASLGSDTGGSIRFPAMTNGIVGLKPTYGRVSRYGVLVLAASLDHVGPMTRRTADAAIVLEAIAGFDPNDPTSLEAPVPDMLQGLARGVDGVTIGFDRSFATAGVDPSLIASMDEALAQLERLGAEVREVELPEWTDEIQQAWFTICASEARVAHEANYPSRANEYGQYLREFLAQASDFTDADYAAASQIRTQFNERFRAALWSADAIATPAGGVPFAFSQESQRGGMDQFDQLIKNLEPRFTFPADFAGTPTISLPCGFTEEGLPLTIQFMGSVLTEPMLCRIGHAYEEATAWHEKHPGV